MVVDIFLALKKEGGEGEGGQKEKNNQPRPTTNRTPRREGDTAKAPHTTTRDQRNRPIPSLFLTRIQRIGFLAPRVAAAAAVPAAAAVVVGRVSAVSN